MTDKQSDTPNAVMAERKRCEDICTQHINVLRSVFQNDAARAIEQIRSEIRDGRIA